jgi:hypothetical protein
VLKLGISLFFDAELVPDPDSHLVLAHDSVFRPLLCLLEKPFHMEGDPVFVLINDAAGRIDNFLLCIQDMNVSELRLLVFVHHVEYFEAYVDADVLQLADFELGCLDEALVKGSSRIQFFKDVVKAPADQTVLLEIDAVEDLFIIFIIFLEYMCTPLLFQLDHSSQVI